MTISMTTYVLNEVSLSDDQIKSVLCGAAGLNPRSTEMVIDPSVNYGRIKLSEKTLGGFSNSKPDFLEERNVKFVLGQLDEWSGSSNTGNAVALRAAELIRALLMRETNG